MRNNPMVILVPLISVAAWICSVPPVSGEEAGRPRSMGNSSVMGAGASIAPAEGVPRVSAGIESAVDESGKVLSRNPRTKRPEKSKEEGGVEAADVVPEGDARKAPGAPKALRLIRSN
jgi:ssDNA-binding replication factor A large subunit